MRCGPVYYHRISNPTLLAFVGGEETLTGEPISNHHAHSESVDPSPSASEVTTILCTTPAGPHVKRKLGEMVIDPVDKDDLPEYYDE